MADAAAPEQEVAVEGGAGAGVQRKAPKPRQPMEPHGGHLKNTTGSSAQIRLKAKKAAKHIGTGGPKKEEKLKEKQKETGGSVNKWVVGFLVFVLVGSAVFTVLSKVIDENKALDAARKGTA